MISLVGDKTVERIAILLPAVIEEIDQPEPVFALMMLSRYAAVEYNDAVRAMQSVVWSSSRSVEERALTDHNMSVTQKDESSVPIAAYLPEQPTTSHVAFWDAVSAIREARDYCAIPLRPEECPTLDEFAQLGDVVEVDSLIVTVHPLGFEWSGTAIEYESEIRIGDLPRTLIDDIANGQVEYGKEYDEKR